MVETAVFDPDWNPVQMSENQNGMARFDAVNYLYSPDSGKEIIFQSITLKKPSSVRGRFGKYASNLELILTLTPSRGVYFEGQELYYQTPKTPGGLSLTLGRKLETWNRLDQDWKLGIWQPRFRWDYIHPETVGLTGAFATLEVPDVKPNLRFVAMASPVYVPERGVPVAVNDGRFISPSPWFIAPTSKIVLFDKDTPITYDLNIPETASIVQQVSFGLMAQIGTPEKGTWGQLAWASKPMNQLLMGYQGTLDLAPPIAAHVDIQPRVGHHQVVSLDAGHSMDKINAQFSALYERPIDDEVSGLWTYQMPQPALLVSPSLAWSATETGDGAKFELSFLKSWGGNGPDVGYDNRATSVFEGRYPFQSSVKFGISSPLRFMSRMIDKRSSQFIGQTQLTYDIEESGSLWSSTFHYLPKEKWALKLGADLLATDVFGKSTFNPSHFVSRYQVNNRIHAGVSYVF